MIVVADTSVILNLCCVQHDHLLQQLFKQVLIPTEVAQEFARLTRVHKRFSSLIMPQWVEVLPAPKVYPVEVDESLGRRVAMKLGIRTIGIIRILIEARDRKLIPSLVAVLDRLEHDANFWISADLRSQALKLVGE